MLVELVYLRIAAIFGQIFSMARKDILDTETVNMKLLRMAYEIIENNLEEESVILAGIKDNGSVIARHMEQILTEASNLKVHIIDLSLDKKNPGEVVLSEQGDFTNKVIILVDDVAMSGKTMLYALKPFLDFHPKKIQTLALVERTHKAFPVKLDYVGLSVATTLQEHIYVTVNENKVAGAYLE
jgi:pyrimidine operon attenuation protein / uracil phosphoribosyltransferase